MCSEKNLERVKNGDAFVVNKIHLIIIIFIIAASVVSSFAIMKTNVKSNYDKTAELEILHAKDIHNINIKFEYLQQVGERLSRIEGILEQMNKKINK